MSTVEHGGGSIMSGGHFSAAAPGVLVSLDGKMNLFDLKPSAFCQKPENKDKFQFSKWRLPQYIQTNKKTASLEEN